MRLYLSSFLLGNAPEALVDLVGPSACCCLVLNALDNLPEARDRFQISQMAALTALGLRVEELDLRQFFDQPDQLRLALHQFDTLWITGGNAFILRKAMRQSGFNALIGDLLAQDAIAYAGFSAAAVVTHDSLAALAPSAAADQPLKGYRPGVILEGLGITAEAIVVHYDSDHPGRLQAAEEAAYYRQNGIPHRLLRDGEALLVRDGITTVVGKPTMPPAVG